MKIETVEDMKKAGQRILKLGPKVCAYERWTLRMVIAVDILIGKDYYLKFIKVKE